MAALVQRYVGPEVLVTDRLRLRRPRIEDAEAMFGAYATDPDVTRYMSWLTYAPGELSAYRSFIAGALERWEAGSEYTWALELRDDQTVVGSLSAGQGTHGVGIGYVLAKDRWGQGLMTEAVRSVVDDAKRQPGVFRIWAYHDVDNPASGRVMEKAGLQREATLRRWAVHPNVSAEPRDAVLYSWARPAG